MISNFSYLNLPPAPFKLITAIYDHCSFGENNGFVGYKLFMGDELNPKRKNRTKPYDCAGYGTKFKIQKITKKR